MNPSHGGGEAPRITTVEDLLKKMRAGTREVHEIRLRDLVIPVRVLSIDEVNQVRKEAIRLATVGGGDEVDKNVHVQKLTLKLASEVTKGQPILSEKLLNMMTVDEITYLYEDYVRVMDSVNPSLEAIPAEAFRQLVDALKKKHVSSRDLSTHQLRALSTAYVDLIQRLESRESPTAN